MSQKNSNISSLTCLGMSLAAGLSWYMWHGFWWAFLHCFLGWSYVIYWILKYSKLGNLII